MAQAKSFLVSLMFALLIACAPAPSPAAPAPTRSPTLTALFVPSITAAPTGTMTAVPTSTATSTPEPPQPAALPTESRPGIALMPKMAQHVSGKLYTYLKPHPLGVRGFALGFTEDKATMRLYFMLFSQELEIGLDDSFRYTSVYGPDIRANIGLKGAWVSEDTFSLSMLMNDSLSESRLVFRDDRVDITVRDETGQRQDQARLYLSFPAVTAATAQTGQHPHSARLEVLAAGITQTVRLNYLLYLPDDYGKNAGQKWPLILYLHGIGERGIDPNDLNKHPLPRTLEQQNNFPFIVVSPQLTLETDKWADRIDALDGLLKQVESTLSVDPRRVYLTGISMGGFGTWALASHFPNRFAALVPIAGGYNYASPTLLPPNLCELRQTPVWVFHGERDRSFSPLYARNLVNALTACGGNVKLTIYPEADHEASFYRAYGEPELVPWLLANARP